MGATAPEQVEEQLVAAVNAGDVDTAVALFEEDAALVAPGGGQASGPEAIRKAITSLVEMQPKASGGVRKTVDNGELTLLYFDWTLEGTGPDGKPYRRTGTGVDVIRRQDDGTYKLAVFDRPGAA